MKVTIIIIIVIIITIGKLLILKITKLVLPTERSPLWVTWVLFLIFKFHPMNLSKVTMQLDYVDFSS